MNNNLSKKVRKEVITGTEVRTEVKGDVDNETHESENTDGVDNADNETNEEVRAEGDEDAAEKTKCLICNKVT